MVHSLNIKIGLPQPGHSYSRQAREFFGCLHIFYCAWLCSGYPRLSLGGGPEGRLRGAVHGDSPEGWSTGVNISCQSQPWTSAEGASTGGARRQGQNCCK